MQPASATGLAGSARISQERTRTRTRDLWTWLGAPALYLLLSLLWIGRLVLTGPRPGTLGVGPDVQIFIWGLRWWPYAIQHGLDPLVSKVIWPPYGSGVLWTTTVPLLSVLTAPVTVAFGPAVSWNLLCVLAPALSAWAAYWLCLELTDAALPATIGGLLFGFSSYEMAQTSAHLQVAMLALVPLAGLVAARYARGRYGGRGLAARVAVITFAQFLISPEVLATLVFMSAITAAGAFLLVPAARPVLAAGVRWTAGGLGLGALLCLPFLIPMLNSMPSRLLNPPSSFSVDLLNLVVPTRLTAVGGAWAYPIAQHFTGNRAEQTGYLGVALLVIVAVAFASLRRNRAVWLLGLMTGLALLLSLGPSLEVDGNQTIWLPGTLLSDIPVLKQAIPDRFAMYTALGTAILVSLWLAALARARTARATHSRASVWWVWALLAIAVVCLIPSPTRHLWWRQTPQWIVRNDLQRLIPPGATVVWLPFMSVDDRGLYAQAMDGMRFRLDDRWLQVIPPAYGQLADKRTLQLTHHTPALRRALKHDLCRFGADYVLVWNHDPGRRRVLAGLGIRPIVADSLLVYRLPQSMCRPSGSRTTESRT